MDKYALHFLDSYLVDLLIYLHLSQSLAPFFPRSCDSSRRNGIQNFKKRISIPTFAYGDHCIFVCSLEVRNFDCHSNSTALLTGNEIYWQTPVIPFESLNFQTDFLQAKRKTNR